MSLKTLIRSYCPNIPFLRKSMSAAKVRSLKAIQLPEEQIGKAENSEVEKARVVASLRERWNAQYDKVVGMAQEHYSKADRILDDGELQDILFCFFAYGFNPDEYLSYGLKAANLEKRLSYISSRDTNIIVYSLNDIVDIDLFYDKWKTYERFAEYYQRSAMLIDKESDHAAFARFIQAHPKFVKKAVRLSKGQSVALVDATGVDDSSALFAELLEGGRTILEEPIVQSNLMSKLNETSVNTVRCITLKTNEGVEVLYTFLKVGRKGSFVDNGGAGGLLVGIDKETGMLITDARDEFANAYPSHPDHGYDFKGLKLPEWDGLIELTKSISAGISGISYIGWDFAHTEHGWIVVEGNGGSQLIGPQIVFQEGIKQHFLDIAESAEAVIPLVL